MQISPYGAPEGWFPSVQVKKGEIPFDEVDNPGNWSNYTYHPVFHSKNCHYLHHGMPSGATVVPINPTTGKYEAGGYEFFYNWWFHPYPNPSNHRVGANKEKMFPEDQDVKLDHDYLQKIGLSRECMEECDALSFYQLLLPIVDPLLTGMDDDPRMGFGFL